MKIVLFSDIHYTTQASAEELKRTYPESEASIAAGMTFGYTQEEKVAAALADILAEHAKAPIDAVLMLGDLSIDDYDYRKLPQNYCARLKEQLFDRLPCPVYAIPGNHDSYPNALWRAVFGYDCQYAVELGDCVFIMADTFASGAASGASGSKYTAPDVAYIQSVMDAHPGSRIFLCGHYFKNDGDSEEFRRLLADERVVCAFRGHTHTHGIVRLPCGKSIVDIGGYGYEGIAANGRLTFNIFDEAWAWGYEVLELDGDAVRVTHVTPARVYRAENGDFTVAEKIEEKPL